MVKKKLQKIITLLIFAFLIVLLIVLRTNSKVIELNAEEFEQYISSEKVFVINAHTPYIGEIKNTNLIAENWENMEFYLDQLPEDKNTPIAIYCRSGRMSTISANQLLELGYTNIIDLNGGMNAWQRSGRSLIYPNFEGEIKEFNITADEWEFNPNQIEVNFGDRVILHFESVEGDHGIYISDYNIDEQLPLGETIDIEFIANKKGIFNFFCGVPCGQGHSNMNGKLIVD